jgi:hypothetical protein
MESLDSSHLKETCPHRVWVSVFYKFIHSQGHGDNCENKGDNWGRLGTTFLFRPHFLAFRPHLSPPSRGAIFQLFSGRNRCGLHSSLHHECDVLRRFHPFVPDGISCTRHAISHERQVRLIQGKPECVICADTSKSARIR